MQSLYNQQIMLYFFFQRCQKNLYIFIIHSIYNSFFINVHMSQLQTIQEIRNKLIKIDRNSNIPLLGLIHIGVIDRGSSLLQVRASTACNMKCSFCSTSANSLNHQYNYEVELDYLIDWIKEAIKLKNNIVNQINIDSVGEPTAYQKIAELIKIVKSIPGIEYVTMQSNGTLLSQDKISALESAGLDRINFSIHSIKNDFSKYLFGSEFYNIEKILKTLELINNSKIELNLTPVWLPGFNDKDIEDIIELAKKLKCKISIQKYEIFRYSRKEKNTKEISWFKFYRKLGELEKKFNIKLKLGPTDFKILKSKKIPLILQKGDKLKAKVIMPGWIKGEMIVQYNNRCITVFNCNNSIGDLINIKILNIKDGIYLAEKL